MVSKTQKMVYKDSFSFRTSLFWGLWKRLLMLCQIVEQRDKYSFAETVD